MDSYNAKRTMLEAESSFTLEGGRLVRTRAGGAVAQQIELAQVRRVRLTYQPLTGGARWICSVEAPTGRIWIPSAGLVGVGRTVDRRADFRAFVQAITDGVAASGATNVAFVQGSAVANAVSLTLLICLGVIGLLLALGALGALAGGGGLGATSWVFLPAMTTIWAASLMWRNWRGNPRRSYDPHALPADFAPVAAL